MSDSNREPRPFVKWAGGKRRLVDALLSAAPEQFSDYYEPFLGGGALYFKLWSLGRIKKAYLNDSNPELINAYLIIQKRSSELMEELKDGKYQNTPSAYYKIRASVPQDDVGRAARFIYLNKTAYNGLYRVNSRGEFNVPFGKYSNPNIADEENISLVSEALKRATISCTDFADAVSTAKKYDFAYFDPPYYPLNSTSRFTKYTANDFTEKDQMRLRDVCIRLTDAGTHVLVSNSDTKKVRELYKKFQIVEVRAARSINCKAEGRGRITELIIKGGEHYEILGVGLQQSGRIQTDFLRNPDAVQHY